MRRGVVVILSLAGAAVIGCLAYYYYCGATSDQAGDIPSPPARAPDKSASVSQDEEPKAGDIAQKSPVDLPHMVDVAKLEPKPALLPAPVPPRAVREPRPPTAAPEPPVVKDAPGDPSDPMAAHVARFKDVKRPLRERQREIAMLARKGDEESIRILMAIGDARVYLNRVAVEALGRCRGKQVEEYVVGKLENEDALIVCAAIRSVARILGEEGIDELTATAERNRRRPDGHEDMVATAIVNVLGMIGSRRAVSFLNGELGRSEEKAWNLEYGTTVIDALDKIGDPAGRQAMTEYANRLEARIPDDPLAGGYFRRKIAEARAKAQAH